MRIGKKYAGVILGLLLVLSVTVLANSNCPTKEEYRIMVKEATDDYLTNPTSEKLMYLQNMYEVYATHDFTQCLEETKLLPLKIGNSAQFVSQDVPSTMVAGQTYQVSITMRNVGSTTWVAQSNYRLGAQNPRDNNIWDTSRAYLSSIDSVTTNQQKTFTFNIKAPSTPGNYNFQWKMLQEFIEWFGDYTPNKVITVAPPCVPPTDLRPSGNVTTSSQTTYVTLSWNAVSGAVSYDVRLDDGTTDRYNDSRYNNCGNSPHYYCVNGITTTSITNVPVKAGRSYSFWVDPIFSPARNYCVEATSFKVICTPRTCSQLGYSCGSWDDGCGSTINCGTCPSGKTCSNGQCVTEPPSVPPPLDDFITHLYQCILERDPDQIGFDSWKNSVASKSISIDTAYHGFFDSAEYQSKGNSNEKYVKQLYNCVLFRDYDVGGFDHWVNILNKQSLSQSQVLDEFLKSQEFISNVLPKINSFFVNPTLEDLFSGKAIFQINQTRVPLPDFGHREAFAVNRPDLGPRTILLYHRCINYQINPNVPLICVARSDDGGETYGPRSFIVQPTVCDYYGGKCPLGYFSVAPSVLKIGEKWYMVYEEGGVGVYYAESADGLNWNIKGPLFSDCPTWNNSCIGTTPSLYEHDNKVYVLYASFIMDASPPIRMRIKMRSGLNFEALKSKSSEEVLFEPTQTGWATKHVSMPRIVRQMDSKGKVVHYLFFEAATLDYGCGGNSPLSYNNRFGWGVARSYDLHNWEFYRGNPIRKNKDIVCGNDLPQPFIRDDGSIFVFHTSEPSEGDPYFIIREKLVFN